MSKKKILAVIVSFILVALLNILVIKCMPAYEKENVTMQITLSSDSPKTFELFYTNDKGNEYTFAADKCKQEIYKEENKETTLSFAIPANTQKVRLDFDSVASNNQISEIKVVCGKESQIIEESQLTDVIETKNASVNVGDNNLLVQADNGDPFIVWDCADWNLLSLVKESMQFQKTILVILACVFIDLIYLFALKKMKQLVMIPLEIIHNRRLIFNLAKNDFKTQFAGSYLGIIWAFVQPVITVLVYWFVFEKGLRAGGVNTKAGINVPFVLWLIAGLVPWFFFSDALNGGTNALTQYTYLVKKVVFKISILPVVKVISALFVHLFFVLFTLILYSAYGYFPDWYTLQIVYYTFCMMILVLGLVYGTCAIVGFFKDLTQIINIILQVGIWMTPIMWNIDAMDINPIIIQIFKLNPMYYIVAGYRDALINKVWFWDNLGLTIYFWIVTALIFGAGNMIFRKLKVHFADVL